MPQPRAVRLWVLEATNETCGCLCVTVQGGKQLIPAHAGLQRNLVYTGVARGKRLVVLVGQRKALAIAIKGSRARRRWSKLLEWLIGCDRA